MPEYIITWLETPFGATLADVLEFRVFQPSLLIMHHQQSITTNHSTNHSTNHLSESILPISTLQFSVFLCHWYHPQDRPPRLAPMKPGSTVPTKPTCVPSAAQALQAEMSRCAVGDGTVEGGRLGMERLQFSNAIGQ